MIFNFDYNETILARKKTLMLCEQVTHLNNNIMLVGASGRGKSRYFIKPNIMQMNSNYVISDPKGEMIYELGTMLEENGYKIKVLNLVDMEHSDTYNPFHYLKNEGDVYKLIEYLFANLQPEGNRTNDTFWDNAAKVLMTAVCFYLFYECKEEDRNFTNVMKLLRALEIGQGESTLDIMFKDLEIANPDHIAVKQYKIFKSVAKAETTSACIAISTAVMLQWFNLDEYRRLTSTDSLELERLGDEKTAVFVTVSDTDRSKNWLAGIFYSQLFDLLCNKEEKNDYHIRFFLDDFVCTAKIPDFDYKMAMIRSRNISCVIAVQDEKQLEKEYGLAAQGIITNCDSYVFLGASNVDICDTVAHRLGDKRYSGADIRKLPLEKCVVICGHEGGIYDKYKIEKHPRYKLMAEHKYAPRSYDLAGKHQTPGARRSPTSDKKRIYVNLKPLIEKIENGSAEEKVVCKKSLFDGKEEEYLYKMLCVSDVHIFPHQHLRDLFATKNTRLSKKLSAMHCDFVVRDFEMKPLFGIEIDGDWHKTDKRQIELDELKNGFFRDNGILLLRFPASDVRERSEEVIAKILETARELTGEECENYHQVLPYRAVELTLGEYSTPAEEELEAISDSTEEEAVS